MMDGVNPLDGLRGVSPFIYTGGAVTQRPPEAGTLESQVHDVRTLSASAAAERFDKMEVAELLTLGSELDGTAQALQGEHEASTAALRQGVEPAVHDVEQAGSTLLEFQHKHVLALSALVDATVASKTDGDGDGRLAGATRFLELRVAQKDIAESLHEEQALILALDQHREGVLSRGADGASPRDDEIDESICDRLMGCWATVGANVQIAEQQALSRLRDRIDECMKDQQLGFSGHLQYGTNGEASLFNSLQPERVKTALDLLHVKQVIEAGLRCHEKSVPDLAASRVRGQVYASIALDAGPAALHQLSRMRDAVLDNCMPFNEAIALRGGGSDEPSAADRAALSTVDDAVDVVMFQGVSTYLAGLDDLLGLKQHSPHQPGALFYSGDMALSQQLPVVFDGVGRLQACDPAELSGPVAELRSRLGDAVDDMSRRLGNQGAQPDTFGCRFADSVSQFETYGDRTPSDEQYRQIASRLLAQDSDLLVPLPDSLAR
jgi:hypothetical protein